MITDRQITDNSVNKRYDSAYIFNNKTKYLIRGLFGIILLFIIILNCSGAEAALKVRYNNKTRKYYGKQITTYLDNKMCKADGTKGLILNKTVMVSYKDIFKKSCKASTSYNSSSGKITIKDNGVTVKLTVGSKNAYVNGKKSKLNQAPLKVKYYNKNKVKVLVPAKFVAKALGYKYVYSSGKSKVSLTSPFVISYNNKYNIYKSYFGGLVYDSAAIDTSLMPLLKINSTVMLPADLVFNKTMKINYSYDSASGNIIIANDYYSIAMNTASNIAYITSLSDGTTTELQLKTAPVQVTRKDTGYSDVMIPGSAIVNALGYYYKWDTKNKVCNIHTKTYFEWNSTETVYDTSLYSNALFNAKTTYDMSNNSIVISLSFINELNNESFVITEDKDNMMLYIDFAGQLNLLAGKTYDMSSTSIDVISSEQSTTGIRIALSLYEEISYYTSLSGNQLNIYITEGWSNDYGMRIAKPDGVDFAGITLEDRYYENKFIIKIPGNWKEFYKSNSIVNNSKNISSFTVSESGTDTLITVITKKLQGSKLVNMGNYIGVIVDDPHAVFDKIVVLDPGHGGKDSGALSKSGIKESDCNYNILYTKAKELFNAADSPVKAYWTRVDDTFITLDDRAKFASKVGADMFVSLHMNSATSTAAKGTEVYYCKTNNSSSPSFGFTSNSLAIKLLYKITPALSTSVRGVKSANYYVIKYNSVPAVLIELGFMSNSTDLGIITNESKQQAAAKAIYDGIVESFAS